MKKILISLLLLSSFYSNAQYSTINIGLTNTSFNDIYNNYYENSTSLNSLRFGFSKSFVTSKWLDTQLNLSYVSRGSSASVTTYDSVGTGTIDLTEKTNYIQLSSHFKKNVIGDFSIFVAPYFAFSVSSSSEYYSYFDEIVVTEKNTNQSNILNTYFGISYLSDNMINFELGWSPTFYNELYFSVGYVL